MPEAWRDDWVAWKREVTRGRRCIVCNRGGKLDPHHVLPARRILDWARERRLALDDPQVIGLLFDPDNGVPVCREDHEAHENGSRRIPFRLLPLAALRFAERLDLGHVLDRLYPR